MAGPAPGHRPGADNFDDGPIRRLEQLARYNDRAVATLDSAEADALRREIQRFTVRRTKVMFNRLIDRELALDPSAVAVLGRFLECLRRCERQRIGNTEQVDLVFLAICTPRFTPAVYEELEAAEHPHHPSVVDPGWAS